MATNAKVTLFERLRESGLLEPAQLEELGRLPEARDPDPRALGRLLVQRGLLTRFQINQVVVGRGKELVLGPYLLLDRLGEGGMGQVYKAQHRRMNRVVALKVIRRDKLRSPDAVKRFYQEVQAAAQLHHPNIVLAYDADQVGNTYFLSMEYVDGRDLARLVKEDGPLPVARACDYVRQAALGLQHAFQRGMVHRDIKPHNLLVSRDPADDAREIVKVLDMGLARREGPGENQTGLTHDGAVIGTPDYLAPEQALNARTADIRSDLYSLGCTFYYLLTGRPPYRAESLTQLLLKHQMEEARPLEAYRPDIPPGVRAIVLRLMNKLPGDRYQTPAELIQALDAVRAGGGTTAGVWPAVAEAPAAAPANEWATLGLDGEVLAEEGEETESFLRRQARRKRGRTGSLWYLWLVAGIPVLLLGFILGTLVYLCLVNRSPRGTSARGALSPAEETQRGPGETLATCPLDALRRDDIPPDKLAEAGGGNPRQAPAELVAILDNRQLGRPWDGAACLAISPDGKWLACGGQGGTVKLWDLATGKEPRTLLGHKSRVNSLAFSADGRLLASCSHDRTARTWNPATGRELNSFVGHRDWVAGVAFSPDGKTLATTSNDRTVRLWDVETGQERMTLGEFRGQATRVRFSPDGRVVAAGSTDLTARTWDAVSGRDLLKLTGQHGCAAGLAFSPDGQLLAIGSHDKTIHVKEPGTGKELRILRGHQGWVTDVAYSPDGKVLASVSPDGSVRLWDFDGWSEKAIMQFAPAAVGFYPELAFSPEGRHLGVATFSGTIYILRLAPPKPAG
jgi:sugar lactone lactonase YvrE/tRNA A-37 threonylcarbamoyl transferase component Bud32